MASKHTVPPVGSSIPTLVSRGLDPLNGAASKRPHSPALEEQAKRLKETEARIHIGWTFNSRTRLAQRQWGRALQVTNHWGDDFTGCLFSEIQPDGPFTADSRCVPVDIGCCRLLSGNLMQQSQSYLTFFFLINSSTSTVFKNVHHTDWKCAGFHFPLSSQWMF